MGESTDGIVLKQIQTLYNAGAIGARSDGQLGELLLAGQGRGDHETAEAAFTTLAERHGPMVLRVCRQMLADQHDADDAFQATFLVLARKARSIRNQDSIASWLHGVARRVAQRAKADAARRRIHERRAAIQAETQARCDDTGARHSESWPELHEAIAQLPARYREPVVLCYLEGLTTEAAAHQLGCPQGTILSRLSRARERLRKTLTRRGLVLPAGWIAVEVDQDLTLALAVPTALLHATVRASLNFAAKQTVGAAIASTTVVNLARGVLYAMTISQWKTVGATALACVLAMGGLQAFAQLGGSEATEKVPATAPANDEDQLRALRQSVAKLQAKLEEANRQNTELQKELQVIHAKLKTLRNALSRTPDETAEPDKAQAASQPNLQANETDQLQYSKLDNETIFMTTSIGDKVKFYDTRTKKGYSLNLPASKESPLKITPIRGSSGVVALDLMGPKITRIAAAFSPSGPWYTQDLREPASGSATPMIQPGRIIYIIGQYVYTFSFNALRWDVVEFPKGITPTPQIASGRIHTFMKNEHIYTFDSVTGKWENLNIRSIFDAPDDDASADGESSQPQSQPTHRSVPNLPGPIPSPDARELGPSKP